MHVCTGMLCKISLTSGCSQKTFLRTETKIISWKSLTFGFYDSVNLESLAEKNVYPVQQQSPTFTETFLCQIVLR